MSIAVGGLGMVTSVGRTAPAACAAIRAGISRPHEVSGFTVLDEIGSPVPLTAHPIRDFAEGFHGFGKWVRLAEGALFDLRLRGALAERAERSWWERLALIAAVPDPESRFLSRDPIDDDRLSRAFLAPVLDLLDLPVAPSSCRFVRKSEVGFLAALGLADEEIGSGRAQRALVVAVDSLIEPLCLSNLSARNRLKTADQPVGLSPGEAGVAALLEGLDAPPSGEADRPRPAIVRSVAVGREPRFDEERNTSQGGELSASIRTVLTKGAAVPFRGDWITSLNGELGQASELGSALHRLTPATIDPEVRLLHPCSEIGDAGAAGAAVAFGLAIHGFWRGAARGDATLLTSRTDEGEVGAAVLARGPDLPGGWSGS
jgi:3-oxoacyl-[acyl-carrier-protein] synthase-1